MPKPGVLNTSIAIYWTIVGVALVDRGVTLKMTDKTCC